MEFRIGNKELTSFPIECPKDSWLDRAIQKVKQIQWKEVPSAAVYGAAMGAALAGDGGNWAMAFQAAKMGGGYFLRQINFL